MGVGGLCAGALRTSLGALTAGTPSSWLPGLGGPHPGFLYIPEVPLLPCVRARGETEPSPFLRFLGLGGPPSPQPGNQDGPGFPGSKFKQSPVGSGGRPRWPLAPTPAGWRSGERPDLQPQFPHRRQRVPPGQAGREDARRCPPGGPRATAGPRGRELGPRAGAVRDSNG